MVDIGLLFSSVGFSKSIAEYIGIIQSLDEKIDKLSKADFNAGIISLEQAVYSNSNFEKESLLREARSFFNKAIGLEQNTRLLLSYIGLAICHYHLGDMQNTKRTLEKSLNVDFKKDIKEAAQSKEIAKSMVTATIKKGMLGLIINPVVIPIIAILSGINSVNEEFEKEETKIAEIKSKILGILETL